MTPATLHDDAMTLADLADRYRAAGLDELARCMTCADITFSRNLRPWCRHPLGAADIWRTGPKCSAGAFGGRRECVATAAAPTPP